MKYFITDITITGGSGEQLAAATDILKSFLADTGYEAFEDETESAINASGSMLDDYRKEHPFAPFSCFSAYIQQPLYDEDTLKTTLASLPFDGLHTFYATREAEDKNWNEAWESEQEQSDICRELGITIDVTQAFGTGSHNTTRMIVSTLQAEDLQGRSVLDCGCGSGILSIAALKLGAERATGYDIDEWSVNNTRHNAQLNGIEDDSLKVVLGDASVLDTIDESFDYVLANINRNILLNDMPAFVKHMKVGGKLILSGFYAVDIPVLEEKAKSLGLKTMAQREDGEWASITLVINSYSY